MPETPVIVADADIPYLNPVLGPMGSLISIPGHRIGPDDVRNADALVVRSITGVNRALLENSRVKFVGSATSGVDHVDQDWLKDRGITFADAAGANAESVVEYVLAVIAIGLRRIGGRLSDLTLGVVGCGRIGGRLVRRAEALGMRVLANDPPLVGSGKEPGQTTFIDLDELLERSDIVSVHVPLTHRGPDSTVGLIDADGISRMKPGAWLIQSSRGGTVDETDAVRARLERHLAFLALDVWTDEPAPDAASVEAADIATPHIAGYSRDAKLSGILRIRDALARALDVALPGSGDPGGSDNRPGTEASPPDLPAPSRFSLHTEAGPAPTDVLCGLVRQMIDLEADDARFRRAWSDEHTAIKRAEQFHRLRASCPPRWSFSRFSLQAAPPGLTSGFLTEGIGIGTVPVDA